MRPQLTEQELIQIIANLQEEILTEGKKKGMGIFISDAEIDGRIQSELREFQRAIDSRLSSKEKFDELIDLAATALWGAASIAKNNQEKAQ